MSLKPAYVVKRASQISHDWLKHNDIKGLLLDIDNTLTPYHSEEVPDDILNWLHALIETGIKFVPYSNARYSRIQKFCDRFDVFNPGIAFKPWNISLRRALRILGLQRNELLIIGDQIFTDCLAGKFAGIRAVLVDPVSTDEFPLTRLVRRVEYICGRKNWGYDDLSVQKDENTLS